MTNKNMHAFVGEVIEPNQSDVSPIVCITAGSDNHPTSVSEAAHMLVTQQKAQGRTVAYLAPVDIRDPIKFRKTAEKAAQTFGMNEILSLFDLQPSDCVYLAPNFLCGAAEEYMGKRAAVLAAPKDVADYISVMEPCQGFVFISSKKEPIGTIAYFTGDDSVVEVHMGPLAGNNGFSMDRNHTFCYDRAALVSAANIDDWLHGVAEQIREWYGDDLVMF